VTPHSPNQPPPFQKLLDRYAADVYRFLVAQVGPADADDCWQETFLAALRAYPRVKRGDNVKSWVLTIAHRKAIDSHRARARRPEPVSELPERGATEHGGSIAEVWDLVRELPDKQRASVVLRFANDLPYAAIGQIAGTSEAAARQNVREGLKRLRREITDD
jgi:RNA polymerase sigma factor (sigma-70 family)